MREVVGIAFSDLHIDDYTKFNENDKRTLSTLRVLFYIRKLCLKYKCPALFMGDLIHKPEVMSNKLFDIVTEQFRALDDKEWYMYCINGNHDCSETSGISKQGPNWIRSFSRFVKFIVPMDMTNGIVSVKGKERYKLFGVPHIDHNVGLTSYLKNLDLDRKLPNVLMLHTGYPGAVDTNGIEVKDSENLNINVLSRFDLVLMGHIHKPQRLSKKVYMVGAPIHQRRTDRGCNMGYWKLYSDLFMEFVPLKRWPKFIDVESEEDKKDDGNYYTVVSSKQKGNETKEVKVNNITTELSKRVIAKKYLRYKCVRDKRRKDLLIKVLEDSE